MPTNPSCPRCAATTVGRHGLTASGTQRYRCNACKKTFTLENRPAGRPLMGDRRLTHAEYQRRWYRRHKK